MKLFKIICGIALPVMLVLMFLRLIAGQDPFISMSYLKELLQTFDPFNTFRECFELMSEFAEDIKNNFSDDVTFTDTINGIIAIFKLLFYPLIFLVKGPIQELIETIQWIIALLDGAILQPNLNTPIDNGYLI